jgi:hypothetical protein
MTREELTLLICRFFFRIVVLAYVARRMQSGSFLLKRNAMEGESPVYIALIYSSVGAFV